MPSAPSSSVSAQRSSHFDRRFAMADWGIRDHSVKTWLGSALAFNAQLPAANRCRASRRPLRRRCRRGSQRTNRFIFRRIAEASSGQCNCVGACRPWDGDQLRFRFSATKKLFGPLQKTVSIEGVVTVTGNSVRLESQLPGLVSEEAVRRVIEKEFDARIAQVTL
jgi:hypothetical protein